MVSTRTRSAVPWKLAIVLALAGTLLLTGCGGGATGAGVATAGGKAANAGATAKPKSSKDPQQAMLEFARCMRKNGVNLPDPSSDGVSGVDAGTVPAEKMQAAQKACKDILPAEGVEGPHGAKLDPKMREQMLKFARCMRKNGVNMPDPSAEGSIAGKVGEDGMDPRSEKFKTAEKACRKYLGSSHGDK